MAINLYLRAGLKDSAEYTVQGALDNLESALDTLQSKYNLQNYQTYLKTELDELRAKEDAIYSIFDINSGTSTEKLALLQSKIDEVRADNESLRRLSGPQLWGIIAPALASKEGQENELQAKFSFYMEDALQDSFKGNLENQTEKDIGIKIKEILNEYLDESDSARTKIRSITAFTFKDIDSILVKRFTPRAKELVKNFIKEYAPKYAQKSTESTITIKEIQDQLMLKFNNWYTITKGATETTVDQEQIPIIKNALITYLQQFIKDDTLINICNEVFSKKASTFLLGKNVQNGITGIMGEIQGLYIMRKLIAPSYQNKINFEWVGGIDNPHEDLRLIGELAEQGTGIQIKNTTRDVLQQEWETSIAFASRVVETFFDFTDIAPEDQDILTQIYQMDTFNVEFTKQEDDYVADSNPDFAPLRERITSLKYLADKILSVFGTALVYMSTASTADKIGSKGNLFYLLGGAKIYAASEMFLNIEKQLRGGERFLSVQGSYVGGDKSVHNIVDYMNRYGTGILRENRNEALGNLVLTTSYLFR